MVVIILINWDILAKLPPSKYFVILFTLLNMTHTLPLIHESGEIQVVFTKHETVIIYLLLFSLQGYSYDLENVDIDFNVPLTPIVGLGQ